MIFFNKRNFTYLQIKRIKRFHLVHQSIDYLFVVFFFLKSSKHSIPNNEPTSLLKKKMFYSDAAYIYYVSLNNVMNNMQIVTVVLVQTIFVTALQIKEKNCPLHEIDIDIKLFMTSAFTVMNAVVRRCIEYPFQRS